MRAKCLEERDVHDHVSNQRNSKSFNFAQIVIVHMSSYVLLPWSEADDSGIFVTVGK